MARLELTGTIAADVSFSIDHDAEIASGNLVTYPAELSLPPTLIADAQGYALTLADRGNCRGLTCRIGARFVKENGLPG